MSDADTKIPESPNDQTPAIRAAVGSRFYGLFSTGYGLCHRGNIAHQLFGKRETTQRAGRANSSRTVEPNFAGPICRQPRYRAATSKAGGRLQLSIDLSYCKFTDDDLKLIDLPDYLTHLNLEATAISDTGVSHLLGAKHLEQLDLGRTEVTEECLETLRKLPALKQVDLNGTAVSPAAQLEMVRFLRSRHSSKDKRSPTTP